MWRKFVLVHKIVEAKEKKMSPGPTPVGEVLILSDWPLEPTWDIRQEAECIVRLGAPSAQV